jgi:carbon-monoxide dehydrogenase medium subunit
MKAAPFRYHAPRTLAEALALLAGSPNARVLAGGQSLMPMLNMRVVSPDDLIDINGIEGLAYIREESGEEGDEIAIGAMTRQRDLEFSPLVAARLPLMAEAIRYVGHRQTRNRGTIGGSLCQLDPSAELPTVAQAHDAVIVARSGRGERRIPFAEFPAGYMTPSLEADEVLVELRFTPWRGAHGTSFIEYARRHGDFAVVSAAAMLALAKDGSIARLSLTLGGVGAAPLRLTDIEQKLTGQAPSIESFAAACASAGDIDALEDPHYPKWYRQRLAVALSKRALAAALERATTADRGAR